jgi:hypothetical protein
MHRIAAAAVLAVFVCILGLSASVTYAANNRCGSARGFSGHEIVLSGDHDHGRFAPGLADIRKEFGAFVAGFDGPDGDDGDGRADVRAVPEWVAYELIGVVGNSGEFAEPDISIKRPSDWYKSPEFAFLWTDRSDVRKKRIDNSYDGIGTIWNRGHLAMADHAQRISWQASCNTHVFWNAVPQAAEMNQGPWLHLENYVAAVSNKFGRVWTIAGPIFDQGETVLSIGDPGEIPIAVPHALFKVIVIETGGEIDVRALIFEQPLQIGASGDPVPTAAAIDGWIKCNQARNRGHVYDHRTRLVSVTEIEARTGLEFFNGQPERSRLISAQPDTLWHVEEQFWTGFICGGQNFVNVPSN